MKNNHTRRRGLTSGVLATGLLAGCAGTPLSAPGPSEISGSTTASATVQPSAARPAVSPPASVPRGQVLVAPPAGGRHGNGGGADTRSAAQALPADWPAEIPLPPGLLAGSTGMAPRWSVMLLVEGGAAEALASAVSFYAAGGFTPGGTAQLHRNGYQVVMVAANRDHSPTETNLTISVIKG
ncbi:hypothetical protein [Pseudarthrobacter sp. H2]|uniref:hypothetical protein n=1 Tax=Pseudarthrobacter sp. H2 TaxID=3418415 RepID=UPI003CF6B80B